MSQVFDAYARYYDLLYRDKDYAGESAYVASHIRKHAPQAKRILELGCGTGAHAEHLARMGYIVHGVDMSEIMLAGAELRKASLSPEIAARLSFELGDARNFCANDTYDAVVSLFHVMSYQTSNDDLFAAFETAKAHLVTGGLFLFDCWYGPAVLTDPPAVREKRLEDNEILVLRIAEPVMRCNENVVDVNYEVMVTEKTTGNTKLIREIHSMRYLFIPEIHLLAKQAGMVVERAYEWMSERPAGLDTWCVMLELRNADAEQAFEHAQGLI